MPIPKIIHRIWFDLGNGKKPPRKYDKMRRSCLRHHPDWTFISWDEKSCRNLVKQFYPWFLDIYDNYKAPIYGIDAIRYLILYQFGGVYVDQDITFLRPMDDMIIGPKKNCPRKNILVRSFYWSKSVSNFVMAAEPRSKFMKFAIERLQSAARSFWHTNYTFVGTMYIAGPAFLRKALKAYPNRQEVCVLNDCAFARTDKCRAKKSCGKYCFDHNIGIHHFTSDWGIGKKIAADAGRIVFIIMLGAFIAFLATKVFYKISCRTPNSTIK